MRRLIMYAADVYNVLDVFRDPRYDPLWAVPGPRASLSRHLSRMWTSREGFRNCKTLWLVGATFLGSVVVGDGLRRQAISKSNTSCDLLLLLLRSQRWEYGLFGDDKFPLTCFQFVSF